MARKENPKKILRMLFLFFQDSLPIFLERKMYRDFPFLFFHEGMLREFLTLLLKLKGFKDHLNFKTIEELREERMRLEEQMNNFIRLLQENEQKLQEIFSAERLTLLKDCLQRAEASMSGSSMEVGSE